MFTVCLFVFASVVAVDPISVECSRASTNEVRNAVAACSALDKDPLVTCEAQRLGALKVFIRIRMLEGT